MADLAAIFAVSSATHGEERMRAHGQAVPD
jgi:hypothetical protein